MSHRIGDRVRTLITLTTNQAICGDTTCTDIPTGAPRTVTDIHHHNGYGVLFDADVHGLACYMEAENIETL